MMVCLFCDKINNLSIINSTGNCIAILSHNSQLPIVKYYNKDDQYYTCEHTIKKILYSKYGHILYDNPVNKYINDFIVNNTNIINFSNNGNEYTLYLFEKLQNSCFYAIEFLYDTDLKITKDNTTKISELDKKIVNNKKVLNNLHSEKINLKELYNIQQNIIISKNENILMQLEDKDYISENKLLKIQTNDQEEIIKQLLERLEQIEKNSIKNKFENIWTDLRSSFNIIIFYIQFKKNSRKYFKTLIKPKVY